MKKILAVTATLMSAITLAITGCGSHEHNYTEYGKDGARHWKYCAEDGKISLNSYEAHSFGANNACVCGATFSSELSIDESKVTKKVLNSGEIKRDDLKIYSTLYYPTVKKSTYPTVIMSHGYNNDSARFDTLATDISKQGYVVCTFDFCGGGNTTKSDGKTTDMSVLTEYRDLCAVMDYVKALDYVDTNNLFLFGQSQGGYVSSYTAVQRKDEVKGLMLYFPAFSIANDAKNKYPTVNDIPETTNFNGCTVGRIYYADPMGIDIYAQIHTFDKPVVICHGDSDTTVNIKWSQQAADSAKGFPDATLHTIAGAGHGFNRNAAHVAQTNQIIFDYILERLNN